MISLLRTTALVLAITVMAGPALAAEVQLPLELASSEAREAVEAALASPSELTDGVVESEAKAFGARGTITAVFEDGLLLSVRFRVFETEDVYRKVKEELTRIHGEGQLKDRTKEGMARNLTITWEVDAEQTLQLRPCFRAQTARCLFPSFFPTAKTSPPPSGFRISPSRLV